MSASLSLALTAVGTNGSLIGPDRLYGSLSSGNTATVTLTGTPVRYLRLTFSANTGWPAGQLSELEAYTS